MSVLVAGKNWVEACNFHNLTDQEVLSEVSNRVHRLQGLQRSDSPVVLLDLDSTLYEVGPRNLQIMVEWARSKEGSKYKEVSAMVEALELHQVKYSVKETLLALGVAEMGESMSHNLCDAIQSAKSYWFNRFFTDSYLTFDRPYFGTREFVNELYGRGAEVVYLTGRDEPNMGKGTRDNLLRDGFPWNKEKTHLWMKPSFHDSDLDFKRSAVQNIRQMGHLVASFENEPPNVVALSELIPDAMHVFVDTVCSDQKTAPRDGLYLLRKFSHE